MKVLNISEFINQPLEIQKTYLEKLGLKIQDCITTAEENYFAVKKYNHHLLQPFKLESIPELLDGWEKDFANCLILNNDLKVYFSGSMEFVIGTKPNYKFYSFPFEPTTLGSFLINCQSIIKELNWKVPK